MWREGGDGRMERGGRWMDRWVEREGGGWIGGWRERETYG